MAATTGKHLPSLDLPYYRQIILSAGKFEGEGSVQLNKEQRSDYEQISARFFGDVQLASVPTNMADAIEQMQTIVKNMNAEKAVVITAYMHPVS